MMKKNLFIFLLSMFIVSGLLANTTDSRKMIRLKVKKKVEHRSARYSPAEAFITNSLLEIRFNYPFKEAVISISNTMTGEIVYSAENINDRVITVYLYENNIERNEYRLNIEIDKNTFISGEFFLE
nr:DUF3244 domain-containing protein [uncultured Bacteroides sp.]